MAITRLNMTKNKTVNRVKVQKREIAKLLQKEKEESARIKVEGVIRDEYLIEALEIVENFVELVISRLQLIKEQKSCPHDMKEAITTLIYVAPRLENCPELMQARKQFSAKYGKKFITDGTNNKDLSVNKKVMWKMSIRVPEPSLCVEYLKAIAKEYDVDWDPVNPEFELTKGSEPVGGIPQIADFSNVQTQNVLMAPHINQQPQTFIVPNQTSQQQGGQTSAPNQHGPTTFIQMQNEQTKQNPNYTQANVTGPTKTTTSAPAKNNSSNAPSVSFDFDSLQKRFEELKKTDDD